MSVRVRQSEQRARGVARDTWLGLGLGLGLWLGLWLGLGFWFGLVVLHATPLAWALILSARSVVSRDTGRPHPPCEGALVRG